MTRSTPLLMDMIGELISSPSVSSVDPALDQGNRGVIDLLANWLNNTGFDVEVMPLPGEPGKANLIATLGSGPGGLVLSGHTDTVPYDEGKWHTDPFKLTEINQRLYGLGTSDMKSFLALAIEASRGLSATDLKEPLILLATADEESTMLGARTLVNRNSLRARYAVIGEPTGLRPVRMHKGILMEAIHLQGRSGHSSDPSLGISALEAMHTVISTLQNWRTELQEKNQNPFFAVPVPTLNLGHIHGGDNPNRICAECELQIDLRPLPGMDIQELRGEMRRKILTALDGTGIKTRFESLFDGTPAMVTPGDAGIIQLTQQLTGHTAGAAAFGTEAPYLQQLGMETVILGPGDIEQAHQPDEYLALERIDPTIDLLKQLVNTICVRGDHLL
ncbi:MAG: acetylornithine deacetylase [Gammaproteobacteria bacterium]|nr:acetylornithine deacetylase [Gammaproteobacteria bacterium]